MSTTPNDGGPAFPDDRSQVGMSLRDWFAGQALAGMAASAYWGENLRRDVGMTKAVAEVAYYTADAMLAARTRPNP